MLSIDPIRSQPIPTQIRNEREMAEKDSVLASVIQCELCFEQYDMLERKPKILDCAHTYCLECLTKHVRMSGKTCPKCRQTFSEAPFFLKSNFQICEALEAVAAKASAAHVPSAPEVPAVSLRFFCTRCNRDATDGCLMNGHDVVDKAGLVLRRATEAKEQARRQFEREGAVLKNLVDSLEALSGAISGKGGLGPRAQRELVEAKKQRDVLDKTSKLVLEVPLTAFQDNGDVPRALDRFLLANGERLFELEEQKRMLEMAKKCTVTVRSDDTGLALGASKTLAIGPGSSAEDRVLSYLVYLLLNKQEPEGAAGGPPSAAPGLESLIADVKKCIIDGNSSDGNDDDEESDEDSDTWSVVSEVSSVSTMPDNCQSAKKVFVAKIPFIATPEELKALFSKFGKVLHVRFLRGPKRAKATGNGPKHHCALIYVPDDATVENILRNRPIAYEKKGQFGRSMLHVQEDNGGKKHPSTGAAKSRQKKAFKKNGEGGPATSKKSKTPINFPELLLDLEIFKTLVILITDSQEKQDNEAARRVFANQVPLDITESDLSRFFSKYGDVISANKRRHGVGQKCMAFITFKDEKSVTRVLASRPIMYNGFDMQVREFRDKPAPNARTAPGKAIQSTSDDTAKSKFNYAETMAAAAAATTVALSAYCVSKLDQQNNQGTPKKQGPKQPSPNKPNPHQQRQHQQQQQQQQQQYQQQAQQYRQQQRQQQQQYQVEEHNDEFRQRQQQQHNQHQRHQPNYSQSKAAPKKGKDEPCCVM
ncbi:Tripartite motif-containing protein 3 [Frankliniella fusca]|uniref:Tripartite motif-containing protein 3 n=1 Tax=Frankliniella fusca TaxID=407009 RepID=A0AAE1H4B9_9NEOP|nr:Tripartite motif-containing protein 3 [Frankliniella fusca]